MSARLVRGVLRRYSDLNPNLQRKDLKPAVRVYVDGSTFSGTVVGLFEEDNILELEDGPITRTLIQLDRITAIVTNWSEP